MARKLTMEELQRDLNLTEAQARKVVQQQDKPKKRRIYFRFKATPEEAAEVARAFPTLDFEKQWK